jgi:glycosyltransferase involved in cell wall biosynthesis
MKLLVFAHTPPPHHGQSRMVMSMVEGFGGDRRGRSKRLAEAAAPATSGEAAAPGHGIRCYHVNARLSEDLADAGSMRWVKPFRLVSYCGEAIWLRWRHGVRAFYYIPAPPKRASLYRDWMVMLLCRWFFRPIIFHWHAVGLGEWLERRVSPWERWLSHRLLDGADLSIVLSRFNAADAAKLQPRRLEVVTNGIADPCPNFAQELAALREARTAARCRLLAGEPLTTEDRDRAGGDPEVVRVVFLAHCAADKGLFDTVEGVRQANAQLTARQASLRLQLAVVGSFISTAERDQFDRVLAEPGVAGWAKYAGFVAEEEKWAILRRADVFCFPTYFPNEGQPANLIEAMAFGLAVVVTRWRAIPEFLPSGYAGLVEPRRPDQVAAALLTVMSEPGAGFRETFLRHFTLERHLQALAEVIKAAC